MISLVSVVSMLSSPSVLLTPQLNFQFSFPVTWTPRGQSVICVWIWIFNLLASLISSPYLLLLNWTTLPYVTSRSNLRWTNCLTKWGRMSLYFTYRYGAFMHIDINPLFSHTLIYCGLNEKKNLYLHTSSQVLKHCKVIYFF